MVGQLANSLMPWRLSAAASTFTVWNCCTPHAFSTCTASAEKPHCGAWGVPFMNSTTGWLSTCCLIRCWVSMSSFYLSARNTGDSSQIGAALELFKAGLREQRAHRAVLSHAVLEEQPAAGRQAAGRVPGELAED